MNSYLYFTIDSAECNVFYRNSLQYKTYRKIHVLTIILNTSLDVLYFFIR